MIVAVGIPIGLLIQARLHPLDAHLKSHPDRNPLQHLMQALSNPYYLQGFAATGLLTVGGFMMMPFMSAFTVHNIGVPISRLPLVYVLVGSFSVVSGPLIGRASDQYGKFNVFGVGCAVAIPMAIIYTHLRVTPLWMLVCVLAVLQAAIVSRNISASALMSALPAAADRGAYMSISSALQQMAGGVGAVLSGMIVVVRDDGLLTHFDRVGYVLVGTSLLTLVMIYFINRKIVAAELVATSSPRGLATSKPDVSVSNQ